MAVRLILPGNRGTGAGVDHALVGAIALGRGWWQELKDTSTLSVEDIARNEGLTGPYVPGYCGLRFWHPMSSNASSLPIFRLMYR